MISYINTGKVDAIATQVGRRTATLGSYFNSLFKRLENVPSSTKEWVGNQSKAYFTRIAQDKKQYLNLVEDLEEICRELKAEATEADSLIKKWNKQGGGKMAKLAYPSNGVYPQCEKTFLSCYSDLAEAAKLCNFNDSNVPDDLPFKKYLTDLNGYLLAVCSACKKIMQGVYSTDKAYEGFSDEKASSAEKITISKVTKNEQLIKPSSTGGGGAAGGASGGASGSASNGVTAAAKAAADKKKKLDGESRMKALGTEAANAQKEAKSIKKASVKTVTNADFAEIKTSLRASENGNTTPPTDGVPPEEIPTTPAATPEDEAGTEENPTNVNETISTEETSANLGEMPIVGQSSPAPTNETTDNEQKATPINEIITDENLVSTFDNETPESNA